jgi:hypothetical protein
LGPLQANNSENQKLYVRGTIVAAAEGLEEAVGLTIRAYHTDSPEVVAAANKVIEADFNLGARERNAVTGLDTVKVFGGTVIRILTADEAKQYRMAERKAQLGRTLSATPVEYTPTARPTGAAASADALATVAAEAAAL